MGKSIFEFGDKFGYVSPWEEGSQGFSAPIVVPTISFAVPVKNELSIEVSHELTFLIDGEYEQFGGEKWAVELVNGEKGIVAFSTSTWTAERGWKIKTKVKSMREGKFSFYFRINEKKSSSFDLNFIDPNKKVCPVDPKHRSHFVIHCTDADMTVESIKNKTKFGTKEQRHSAAHIYVLKDGSRFNVWPLTQKDVWATKAESLKGLKGQMFHVELCYKSPSVPTEDQYNTLAEIYLEASNIEKCWPIIVPHIEVDRGIADGHHDPVDFDYNHFYALLKGKNVPIDRIPKFDHDRYWGKPTYKVPWKEDKYSWPPILKGNPHQK